MKLTHPNIASLVAPLRYAKRGTNTVFTFSTTGEERISQRGVAEVGRQLFGRLFSEQEPVQFPPLGGCREGFHRYACELTGHLTPKIPIHHYGRYLRPGLSAHTAQALATGRYPLLSLTQKKLFYPLSAAGKERVGQRSVAGVSKLINMPYAGNNQIFLS